MTAFIIDEVRTVQQLDAAYNWRGRNEIWMSSQFRADLVKQEKADLKLNKRFNKSKYRTRSLRWRAGSKSSKPKHR